MIDENEVYNLPHLPALGFACKCALILRKHYEDFGSKYEDENYHAALSSSLKIATEGKGLEDYSPEAHADICVDTSNIAKERNLERCFSALEAAAGTAYAAGMINDVYNGYSKSVSEFFFSNILRSIKAAFEIEPELVQIAFSDFKEYITKNNLENMSSIPLNIIEK